MRRAEQLDFFRSHLDNCLLCPRECGVARAKGETGFCKAGTDLKVASHCLHTGEEPPISGKHGSGAIFFAHCNMACVYCQNFPISQLGHGNITATEDLTGMMLGLQRQGAHNINLVTPTHFLPQIVEAICSARKRKLMLPIVYNTSGYESVETIRMLDGLIQVYLVDMRYSSSSSASRYSQAPDYPHRNKQAVAEMIRRAGLLKTASGLATEGVIIRHLLLPTLMNETGDILAYISRHLSKKAHISLMSQYFPANRAHQYAELDRKISEREHADAAGLLDRYGLRNGWVQEPGSAASPVA